MKRDNEYITILFLSWRDIKAPKKGGAEVFTHEMLSRINHEKYKIIHFSPYFKDCLEKEVIDNVTYLRKGNILTVIYYAWKYYMKNKQKIDYVVDQVNTHRFFSPFWVMKNKRIFFIHQMTKEIWIRNLKWPWGKLGMISEGFMTKIYRKSHTLTVSNSTKKDLIDYGFEENRIHILPEGIDFIPWKKEKWFSKEGLIFTYVGRYSAYKGIDATVEAYCKLNKKYQNTKLWIIGKKNEEYIEKKLNPIIKRYGIKNENIKYWGFVEDELKLELMSKSHCLVFPSEREGWGLTVTEGAAVGTPSIVYNSAGLIDAVDEGRAGFMVSKNNVDGILEMMILSLEEKEEYNKIQNNAYEFSKLFNWEKTAIKFDEVMMKICEGE